MDPEASRYPRCLSPPREHIYILYRNLFLPVRAHEQQSSSLLGSDLGDCTTGDITVGATDPPRRQGRNPQLRHAQHRPPRYTTEPHVPNRPRLATPTKQEPSPPGCMEKESYASFLSTLATFLVCCVCKYQSLPRRVEGEDDRLS